MSGELVGRIIQAETLTDKQRKNQDAMIREAQPLGQSQDESQERQA